VANRQLKIGDKIRHLEEDFKGRIIGFDKGFALVESEEGFTYSLAQNKLILDQKIEGLESDFALIDAAAQTSVPRHQVRNEKGAEKKELEARTSSKGFPVLDLHLHQLLESEKGMTKHDKLLFQLQKSQEFVERARGLGYRKVILIHGIGSGKLKSELLRIFQSHPVDVEEASYTEFGQGAMEISLIRGRS